MKVDREKLSSHFENMRELSSCLEMMSTVVQDLKPNSLDLETTPCLSGIEPPTPFCFCFGVFWFLVYAFDKLSVIHDTLPWGTWVALSVKHLTLDFGSGHDLSVVE